MGFDKSLKTIQIGPDTRKKLKKMCAEYEMTYDEILNHLMNEIQSDE